MLLAGADGAVLFLAPDPDSTTAATGTHHAPVVSADFDRIAAVVSAHLGAVDVVLAEGFAPLHDLLVEVRRRAIPTKPVSTSQPNRPPLWLTITDEPTGLADEYGFDELTAVAGRIATARTASNRNRTSSSSKLVT